MKKIFTITIIAMIISSLASYAAESRIENFVNNLISPITC